MRRVASVNVLVVVVCAFQIMMSAPLELPVRMEYA